MLMCHTEEIVHLSTVCSLSGLLIYTVLRLLIDFDKKCYFNVLCLLSLLKKGN